MKWSMSKNMWQHLYERSDWFKSIKEVRKKLFVIESWEANFSNHEIKTSKMQQHLSDQTFWGKF